MYASVLDGKNLSNRLGSVVILRALRNCWKQNSLPLFLIQILQREKEQKAFYRHCNLKSSTLEVHNPLLLTCKLAFKIFRSLC